MLCQCGLSSLIGDRDMIKLEQVFVNKCCEPNWNRKPRFFTKLTKTETEFYDGQYDGFITSRTAHRAALLVLFLLMGRSEFRGTARNSVVRGKTWALVMCDTYKTTEQWNRRWARVLVKREIEIDHTSPGGIQSDRIEHVTCGHATWYYEHISPLN